MEGYWAWNEGRGEYEWRQRPPRLAAGPLDALALGVVVVLPVALLLLGFWVALPALWLDAPRFADLIVREGAGGLVSYLLALAQWFVQALPGFTQTHWPWLSFAALGGLVLWVVRQG